MIHELITDLVRESGRRIEALAPRDADAVRAAGAPVIAFSPPVAAANRTIKTFLFERLYRHWQVNRMTAKARRLTAELFALLHANPALLRDDWRAMAGEEPGTARAAEAVTDYIAGMTDRFARQEHRRLTDIDVSG